MVRGGSALTVKLHTGDRVKLVDKEGLQPAELTATGNDGRPDPAMFGEAQAHPVLRIFGSGPAGETVEFTASRNGALRVVAPGETMDFARQNQHPLQCTLEKA